MWYERSEQIGKLNPFSGLESDWEEDTVIIIILLKEKTITLITLLIYPKTYVFGECVTDRTLNDN